MLKTVSDILPLATSFLTEHQIEHPRRSAEELLAHVLGLKRIDLYLQYDRPLEEKEVIQMRQFLKRCMNHEPIQYIMGEVEFYGCRIEVSSNVLIPRHESEILVDLAVKKIKEKPHDGKILWDLCTGSGCLGLGIKRACPELTVVLSDISPQAIAQAEKNRQKNNLDVECRQGDLLEPFINQKADFVICNPPYISEGEMQTLDRSVRGFEPHAALLGGPTGLEFYQRLSRELPAYLNPGSHLFF